MQEWGVGEPLVPSSAHVLLGFSFRLGTVSYRSSRRSWYIKALVQSLRERTRQEDILGCLTRTNSKIASLDGDQMCYFESSLTKKLVFME